MSRINSLIAELNEDVCENYLVDIKGIRMPYQIHEITREIVPIDKNKQIILSDLFGWIVENIEYDETKGIESNCTPSTITEEFPNIISALKSKKAVCHNMSTLLIAFAKCYDIDLKFTNVYRDCFGNETINKDGLALHSCSATESDQLIDPAYRLFSASHQSYEILSDLETERILKNDLLTRYYAAYNRGVTNDCIDEVIKNCNKMLILDPYNEIAKRNLPTAYEIKSINHQLVI